MKTSVLLAGIASLALVGTAAWAADSNVHELTVQLPGGGVEHIIYAGNVAPKVHVVPMASMPQVAFAPMAFGFPDMARIQAEMAAHMAQMHAMIAHANAIAAQSMANAPNGAMTIGTNGGHSYFCARSVQITTDAHGKQNVVEHTSGNCGGGNSQTSAPANHPSSGPALGKGTPI